MGFVHTKHGHKYHVEGCPRIAGRDLIYNAGGLAPCEICCQGLTAGGASKSAAMGFARRSHETSGAIGSTANSGDGSAYGRLDDGDGDAWDLPVSEKSYRLLREQVGSSLRCIDIDALYEVLTQPDLQHGLGDIEGAELDEQIAEEYRILLHHGLVHLPANPTWQELSDAFSQRGEENDSNFFINIEANGDASEGYIPTPRRAHFDGSRHWIERPVTQEYSPYELYVLCTLHPSMEERTTAEMEIVYETFAQTLWAAYDADMSRNGIPERDVSLLLSRINIANVSQIRSMEPTVPAAFTDRLEEGDKNIMRMYVRSNVRDAVFVMFHDALHFLTAHKTGFRGRHADVVSGFELTHHPEAMRYFISNAFQRPIRPQSRVAINEVMTNRVARYLLRKSRLYQQHYGTGYDRYERALSAVWRLLPSGSALCECYLANDWELLSHEFTSYAGNTFSLQDISELADKQLFLEGELDDVQRKLQRDWNDTNAQNTDAALRAEKQQVEQDLQAMLDELQYIR